MGVLKILIVEDNTIQAMEIENCLEDFGYDVVGVAVNDKQAISIFKEKKPDLVLMDVELKDSKMDGVQLVRALRKLEAVPFIYLSGHYNNAQIQQRVIASNPENFLFKPHDLEPVKLSVAIEIAIRKFTDNEDAKLQTGIYRKEDYLWIKKDGTHYRTAISKISHATTSEGGIVIFSEENFFPYNITLRKFAEKVHQHSDLMQVHQSYVINLNKVTEFNLKDNTTMITYKYAVKEGNEMKTVTKVKEIPIGREYKNKFLLRHNALDTKK